MKSNVAMGGEQKQIGVKSDANTLYDWTEFVSVGLSENGCPNIVNK